MSVQDIDLRVYIGRSACAELQIFPYAIILVISLGPLAMPSWNHLPIANFPALLKSFNSIIKNMYGHTLINHKAKRRYL